jgi:hypothetical protein
MPPGQSDGWRQETQERVTVLQNCCIGQSDVVRQATQAPLVGSQLCEFAVQEVAVQVDTQMSFAGSHDMPLPHSELWMH